MKHRLWPFLTCVGILFLGGGISLSHRIVILQLENLDHPRTVRILFDRSGRFSLSYVHSMYDEPVLEEFRVVGDAILLEGVRTRSPAVMEYYGFDAVREFHPVEKRMGEIFLRVRMGTPQSLLHGDRSLSLDQVGGEGERIRLRARTLPLAFYLLGIFPGGPG